jgi:subtilisin family serine protease
MRHITPLLACSALLPMNPLVAMAQLQRPNAGCGDSICQQVVVQLEPNESVTAINAAFGTSTVRGVPGRNLFLLQVPTHASAQIYQSWLTNDPRVAWAELNYMVVAPHGGTQSFFLSASVNIYQKQESLQVIGADLAQRWATGAGQVVAVLDTGVDPEHQVMAGRVAPGGFNYINNNADYRDQGEGTLVGHGTIVSGLVLRVAPEARILPLKVLNADGVGTSFYVAQAMYDAIDRGATIINASLGTIRPSQAISEAAQAAVEHGILVIAAAGNTDRSEPRSYPAAFDGVLSVAGTDQRDAKAPFSDFGTWVDIAAPAVDLAGPFPGNAYALNSGNSLAAAVVSGSAALVRSQQPQLTPQRVALRLMANSDDIDAVNPGYEGLLGSGRVNTLKAVIRPLEAPIPRK